MYNVIRVCVCVFGRRGRGGRVEYTHRRPLPPPPPSLFFSNSTRYLSSYPFCFVFLLYFLIIYLLFFFFIFIIVVVVVVSRPLAGHILFRLRQKLRGSPVLRRTSRVYCYPAGPGVLRVHGRYGIPQ